MSISATTLAHSTIRQLLELGVSDFVLSPGSRNAPLSLALLAASRLGLADLHVRLDERGAAFFALGISKASNKYVALICTSGTAVANYHPAALEAYHANQKLLFLTADRPERLRRTGSNQTTLQVGLLAPLHTIDTSETLDLSKILNDGPVHVNLCFDEPLADSTHHNWLAGFTPNELKVSRKVPEVQITGKGKSILFIGHDRAGFTVDEVRDFARKLGAPVISEDPLSFPESIPHAVLFLEVAPKADQVIVIGRTSLSRSVNSYISRTPEIIVIDPRTVHIDTKRTATQILSVLPTVLAQAKEFDWNSQWKIMGAYANEIITNELEWSEQKAIQAITSHLPGGSSLFIGSSRPIRDVEAFAPNRADIATFANRGLAGIDGNISTAFGISQFFERNYAVLGDLTFLHDLSALANAITNNLTIFIIDNNGGGIFSTLSHAGVDGFDEIFGTPHNLNLLGIIESFGLSVEKVKGVSDIQRVLAESNKGLHFVIVEVPSRTSNALKLKAISQSVSNAVRIGSNLA